MAGESAHEVARRAREKAERLQRRAELFERGAEGEQATADVLAVLPAGWTALHDVRWPNRRLANIDHIVVGPGGVFVIDSKNWSGHVSIEDGRLRQNGRFRDKAVAGCADAGLAIAEIAGTHADKVFPVLCFAGQSDVAGWCRDVMVCSTDNVTHMLLTRPPVLDAAEVADTRLRLATQLQAPAGSVPSTGRTLRPRAVKNPVRTPRGRARKRARSIVRPIVGLCLLLVLATNGPQFASAVGKVVSDYMTSNLVQPDACADQSTHARSNAKSAEEAGSSGRERSRQKGTGGVAARDTEIC
ncbi:MAG TPA: nuclease-related domain-containing protein [Nocardioidaceae bacterium]|nr:nuclease-related domain-containing protein [Nocardioidaceae bacterium]